MKRHLVLVGVSGAGKTTVGRVVAGTLGTGFVDVDELIEAGQGLSISRFFAERGEAAFRALERRAVQRALAGQPGVVAPGAGWAAEVGNLEAGAGRALVVYLRTEPTVAAARMRGKGDRPLLTGGDPQQRLQDLLRRRQTFYEAADAVVETDHRSVTEVAEEVVALARSRGGW